MEILFVDDLEPGMRLDSSLHLGGGELFLYRYQAVDSLLLESLKRSGAAKVYLCEDEGEVQDLILTSGLKPVALEDYPAGTRFEWGLYATNGRKLIPAGHALLSHRRHALLESGVDVVFEPATDTAPTVARNRRLLTRKSAPRRGWGSKRASSLLPGPASPEMQPSSSPNSRKSGRRRPGLSYAFLASDAEDLMNELSIGLCLDVPRAVDAARSTIDSVSGSPHQMVTDAIATLSSGKLRDHAAASCVVSSAAARAWGIGRDECLEIAMTALLHDMTMVWVREDVAAEPSPLGESQRRVVQRHPLRAFHSMIDADGMSPSVALTSLSIHERTDGSGYPMGLRAGETPAASRLVSAVDVLCAILAPRPHREERSGRRAMELCVRMAGEGSLDGDAVRALLRAVGLYPLGSRVRLSTGELANVIATNGDDYGRPVVEVVRTSAGLAPAEARVMDLSKLSGISIEGPAKEPESSS